MSTCVSGSPKRALYSSTFGPSGVSMIPAYSAPRKGVPRRESSASVGPMTSSPTRSRASPVRNGAGA